MFNGLKIYTVHVKKDVVQAAEKPIFLREGFNIFAFALTGFWLLYHRLWLPMIAVIACNVGLVELADRHWASPVAIGILQLALNALVGFHANDWLRSKLARQGYLFADITTGDSLLRAERRYFERYLKSLAV